MFLLSIYHSHFFFLSRVCSDIYVDAKPLCRDYEPHRCNCRPPPVSTDRTTTTTTTTGSVGQHLQSGDSAKVACGDSCLNRLVYTECGPGTCPCGSDCSNQRIQRHDWSPGLEKIQTLNRGYGVRTNQKIPAGEFDSVASTLVTVVGLMTDPPFRGSLKSM